MESWTAQQEADPLFMRPDKKATVTVGSSETWKDRITDPKQRTWADCFLLFCAVMKVKGEKNGLKLITSLHEFLLMHWILYYRDVDFCTT